MFFLNIAASCWLILAPDDLSRVLEAKVQKSSPFLTSAVPAEASASTPFGYLKLENALSDPGTGA